VIRGYRRFQRREHVNLACAADLENGPAAIAHIQVAFRIECDAGGDAHALDIRRNGARRRDLIDDSILAAGGIQHAFAIHREARGVHDVGDERARFVIEVDLVNRHRRLLPARSAERHVGVSERVNGRVADWV